MTTFLILYLFWGAMWALYTYAIADRLLDQIAAIEYEIHLLDERIRRAGGEG